MNSPTPNTHTRYQMDPSIKPMNKHIEANIMEDMFPEPFVSNNSFDWGKELTDPVVVACIFLLMNSPYLKNALSRVEFLESNEWTKITVVSLLSGLINIECNF